MSCVDLDLLTNLPSIGFCVCKAQSAYKLSAEVISLQVIFKMREHEWEEALVSPHIYKCTNIHAV